MAPGLVGVMPQASAAGCRGVAGVASILQLPSPEHTSRIPSALAGTRSGESHSSIILIPYRLCKSGPFCTASQLS